MALLTAAAPAWKGRMWGSLDSMKQGLLWECDAVCVDITHVSVSQFLSSINPQQVTAASCQIQQFILPLDVMCIVDRKALSKAGTVTLKLNESHHSSHS